MSLQAVQWHLFQGFGRKACPLRLQDGDGPDHAIAGAVPFRSCKRSRRPRFLHRLETCFGDKTKRIASFAELDRLDPKGFLPINNRVLTRMRTVSSGMFLAVNSAGSAIKAGIASKGNKAAFAKAFFLNINYPGIGRFAVACFFDAKYIREDVATVYKTRKRWPNMRGRSN